MKPPITFVQDDEDYNEPYSTFDELMGRVLTLFAAIGMVAAAGLAGYIFGGA